MTSKYDFLMAGYLMGCLVTTLLVILFNWPWRRG